MKRKRLLRGTLVLVVLVFVALCPFVINAYIKSAMSPYIINEKQAYSVGADCILILGAGLKADGTPNLMLRDRLDKGISLYKAGAAPKLLLSGDNGQEQYDEVNAMKAYAQQEGVPKEDIFLDHAGFSTYDSMYRAKAIFQVKSLIVVTQEYHQYRALYAARGFELNAYGVSADHKIYYGQQYREFREVLARNKDFFKMLVKPKPTYLGDSIPISGSGLASHD